MREAAETYRWEALVPDPDLGRDKCLFFQGDWSSALRSSTDVAGARHE